MSDSGVFCTIIRLLAEIKLARDLGTGRPEVADVNGG